jgi:phage tail-like protein
MALDPFAYPVGSYSFELTVFKNQKKWGEIRCQSVSGVEITTATESADSGKKKPVPTPPLVNGVSYKTLVVTKGVVVKLLEFDRAIMAHMRDQAANKAVPFLELTLLLLDGEQQPLRCWNFRGVVVTNWKVSSFDATKSGYTTDEISFQYKEFDMIKV